MKMNNLVHKHSVKFNKCKKYIDRKKESKSGYKKHKEKYI